MFQDIPLKTSLQKNPQNPLLTQNLTSQNLNQNWTTQNFTTQNLATHNFITQNFIKQKEEEYHREYIKKYFESSDCDSLEIVIRSNGSMSSFNYVTYPCAWLNHYNFVSNIGVNDLIFENKRDDGINNKNVKKDEDNREFKKRGNSVLDLSKKENEENQEEEAKDVKC